MPQLPVPGPLDEADFDHDLRTDPVSPQPRQALRPGEHGLRDLELVEARPQTQEQLRIEAGANLSRKDEVVVLVESDQQRAEPDAAALRIGETADHQLLLDLALHL